MASHSGLSSPMEAEDATRDAAGEVPLAAPKSAREPRDRERPGASERRGSAARRGSANHKTQTGSGSRSSGKRFVSMWHEAGKAAKAANVGMILARKGPSKKMSGLLPALEAPSPRRAVRLSANLGDEVALAQSLRRASAKLTADTYSPPAAHENPKPQACKKSVAATASSGVITFKTLAKMVAMQGKDTEGKDLHSVMAENRPKLASFTTKMPQRRPGDPAESREEAKDTLLQEKPTQAKRLFTLAAVSDFKLCFKSTSSDFLEALANAITSDFWESGCDVLVRGQAFDKLFTFETEYLNISIEGIQVVYEKGTSFGPRLGEETLLGDSILSNRTVTVQDTMVVKALRREDLRTLLEKHPEEKAHFDQVSEEYKQICKNASVADVPILEGASPELKAQLAKSMEFRVLFPGDTIIMEGATATSCIVIEGGTVDVTVCGRASGTLGKGAVFGELCIFDSVLTRRAGITAETVCHIGIIHRSLFEMVVAGFPKDLPFRSLLRQGQEELGGVSKNLRELGFFKSSSHAFIHELSMFLEDKVFVPGQVILKEGDISQALYIVRTGLAACLFEGARVGVIKPGSLIGELSVFGERSAATATVKAEEMVFAHSLHRAALLATLERYPDEIERFLAVVEERLSIVAKNAMSEEQKELTPDRLQKFEMFSRCPRAFLVLLAKGMELRLFPAGEDIVVKGETSDCFFVMHEGEATSFNDDFRGPTYKQDDVFGEFCALGLARTREMSVRASTFCIVSQMRGAVLWNAIDEFPDAATTFQHKVLMTLENSILDGLQGTAFFRDAESKLLLYMVMNSKRSVELPDTIIVQENCQDANEKAQGLVVINRGIAEVSKRRITFCELTSGDHFGGLVALDVQRTHMLTLRAQTMCHIICLGRNVFATFFAGSSKWRSSSGRKFLEHKRSEEVRENNEMMRILRMKEQKVSMEKHIWQKVGLMFPHIHLIGQPESSNSEMNNSIRKHQAWSGWVSVVRRMRNHKMLKKVMDAAGGPFAVRTRCRQRENKATSGRTASEDRFGECGDVAESEPMPSQTQPAAQEEEPPKLGLPGLLKATGGDDQVESQWDKKLAWMLTCRNSNDLYTPR